MVGMMEDEAPDPRELVERSGERVVWEEGEETGESKP
jgi:hypothetical protein